MELPDHEEILYKSLKSTLEDVIVSLDRDERKITRLQAKVAERTLYKEFLENKIKALDELEE